MFCRSAFNSDLNALLPGNKGAIEAENFFRRKGSGFKRDLELDLGAGAGFAVAGINLFFLLSSLLIFGSNEVERACT